ncbi:MAG: tripartite tricarboxylate transporter TctB family protein [Celeribacter sp.]
MNRQLLFLYVILAVSVGYLISAMSLGAPTDEGRLTPSFFPILVGAAAIVFCGVLITQTFRAAPAPKRSAEPPRYTHLWIVVAIFFYILAFKTVGYFTSSGLFVFALIVLFSSFEKLIQKALISVAVVLAGYVMFQYLFGVRLPTLWG